jgi:ClpP class serine protease
LVKCERGIPLGRFPAASLIKVIEQKPVAEIDDNALIMADVGQKAIAQVKAAAREFLHRSLSAEQAEKLAETLSTGQWTHDYPISAAEAKQLGLPVNTDMPDEVMELMSLYPQPVRHSGGGVEYLPVPRQKGAGRSRLVRTDAA